MLRVQRFNVLGSKKCRTGWEVGKLKSVKASRLSGLPAFKL
jgi:hypothetical protein